MNTEDKKPTIALSTTSKKSSKSVTPSDKNNGNSGGSGSSRKRRFSATSSNSTVSQVHVNQQLPVNIKQEVVARKDAKLCGNPGALTTVSHENLFSTLGMGFGEENRIKLFTNSLMKEIQSQIFAALSRPTTIMMASTATAKTKTTTNRGK